MAIDRVAQRFAAAFLAGCVLLLAAVPALASSGVSVDLGRIDITQELSPGGAYTLPTIGVRNPGTETTSYVMVANPVQDPVLAAPPSAWFEFSPANLTLEPGETRPVRVRIVLPRDAPPGDYMVLVGAQIAKQGTGASVGAAAAARTTFTIRPADGLQALGIQLRRVFSDLLPWSAIVPAVLIGGLGLWLVRRRFTFRLGIERR
jgi:hypothetical protein